MNTRSVTAVCALLSSIALAGCSDGSASKGEAAAARLPAGTIVPAAALESDASNEPTPAERRLEWVRAPVSPSRTASAQALKPAETLSDQSQMK